MAPAGLRVAGWGFYVPERVLHNDDLTHLVDTSDEWIYTRTGIRRRHIASENETTGSMAVRAARAALHVAGLEGCQIDLTIVTTTTPDYLFPATASLVQDALGTHGGAYDMEAGCAGFVYALAQAWGAIATGLARRVLIVGSDAFTRLIDWTDRNTCVLFGDGAGAAVVTGTDDPAYRPYFTLHSDGAGADAVIVPAGGSRRPASAATVAAREHYVKMNGAEVFKFSKRIVPQVAREVLGLAGIGIEDVRLFVPHQANARILLAAARRLGLPREQLSLNIEEYGNTSAASIPIALAEPALQGRLAPGDRVLVAGFGAGLAWGAALLRWG
jgi:3-oxoacyl-[acyl-carrier-protein] synthase-3